MSQGELDKQQVHVIYLRLAAGATVITAVIEVTGKGPAHLVDEYFGIINTDDPSVFFQEALGAGCRQTGVALAGHPDKESTMVDLNAVPDGNPITQSL